MTSQSIPALSLKLARLRMKRARENGWTPPPILVAVVIALVLLASIWSYEPPAPPAVPHFCRANRVLDGEPLVWPDATTSLLEAHSLNPIADHGFEEILMREDAADVFHHLLTHAEQLEGQIYAACGLLVLEDREGERVLARMTAENRWMTSVGGCSHAIYPIDWALLHYGNGYVRPDFSAPADRERFAQMMRTQENPPIPF